MAFVQRGNYTLSGASEVVIDITPVTVGKAFAKASMYGNTYGPSYTSTTAELITIVGGKYTQLRLAKTSASNNAYVSWEVIEDENLSVQSGVLTTSASPANIPITTVDLTKAFVVFTVRVDSNDARAFTRAYFSSASQLTVQRGASATSIVVAWFVVQWEGASVQSGIFDTSGTTSTRNISAIDLEKAFLLFSSRFSTVTDYVHQRFFRGVFLSTTQARFQRYMDGDTASLSFFVVQHPDIQVQSGTIDISGGGGSYIALAAIDLAASFIPVPYTGNGYLPNTDGNSLVYGWSRQYLTTTPRIYIVRVSATGMFYAAWFVASFPSSIHMNVNIGGAWKKVMEVHVNIDGVWKKAQAVHVNIGGVWKKS